MDLIVEQTNLYAWQTIAAASELGISAGSRIMIGWKLLLAKYTA